MACVLAALWCRAGCSVAAVAGALAFFPPDPPSYEVRDAEDLGEVSSEAGQIADGGSGSGTSAANVTPASAGSRAAHSATSVGAAAAAAGGGVGVEEWRSESSGASKWSRLCCSPACGRGHGGGMRGGVGSASWHVHARRCAYAFDAALAPLPFAGASAAMVRTRRGNEIPVFTFEYPGAYWTLLYSHGNATDCGLLWDHMVDLAVNLRVNVVAYDYTGYGGGGGGDAPTEAKTYADVEAVCDFVLQSAFCHSVEQIIAYGQSLGSGPTVYLACQRPVRAVVLHSPILSGMRVVTASRLLACCDIYPNLERMARLRATAVFILHGQRDAEVGVTHGERLYQALPVRFQRHTRPWFPPMAGHNDIPQLYRHEYFQRLRSFIVKLQPGTADYTHEPIVHVHQLARLRLTAATAPQAPGTAPDVIPTIKAAPGAAKRRASRERSAALAAATATAAADAGAASGGRAGRRPSGPTRSRAGGSAPAGSDGAATTGTEESGTESDVGALPGFSFRGATNTLPLPPATGYDKRAAPAGSPDVASTRRPSKFSTAADDDSTVGGGAALTAGTGRARRSSSSTSGGGAVAVASANAHSSTLPATGMSAASGAHARSLRSMTQGPEVTTGFDGREATSRANAYGRSASASAALAPAPPPAPDGAASLAAVGQGRMAPGVPIARAASMPLPHAGSAGAAIRSGHSGSFSQAAAGDAEMAGGSASGGASLSYYNTTRLSSRSVLPPAPVHALRPASIGSSGGQPPVGK
jgi:predicted esterase